MQEPTAEIAVTKPDITAFASDQERVATSLLLKTDAEKRLFMKALQECDAVLVEQVNKDIKITDYVIHDVQKMSEESGELIPLVRLVVIDDKGMTYETTSDGIRKSLIRACWAWGKPPWKPGRVAKVRSKMKGKRNIFWLDFI